MYLKNHYPNISFYTLNQLQIHLGSLKLVKAELTDVMFDTDSIKNVPDISTKLNISTTIPYIAITEDGYGFLS